MTPEEIARKGCSAPTCQPQAHFVCAQHLLEFQENVTIPELRAALAASEQRGKDAEAEAEKWKSARDLTVHAMNQTSAKLQASERALERVREDLAHADADLRHADSQWRNLVTSIAPACGQRVAEGVPHEACFVCAALASPGSPQEKGK